MVDYEVHGRVGVLTINRPEKPATPSTATWRGASKRRSTARGRPEVWVGVLTGEGTCSAPAPTSRPINEGKAGEMQTEGRLRRASSRASAPSRSSPPSTGRLSPAAARSCCRATSSWRRTQRRFGVPEVKRSLVAAAGGAVPPPPHAAPQHRPRAAVSPAIRSRPSGRYQLRHGQRAVRAGQGPRGAPSCSPSASRQRTAGGAGDPLRLMLELTMPTTRPASSASGDAMIELARPRTSGRARKPSSRSATAGVEGPLATGARTGVTGVR